MLGRRRCGQVGPVGEVTPEGLDTKVERAARGRLYEGLRGEVVEIGFGSGLNAGFYSSEVTKVLAIEPSIVSTRVAQPRIAESSAHVELAGLDGQHLDLPSERFDAVLSTWTLCTIPDLASALGEIPRVLKPASAFHFVEHGHAPDANIAFWQEPGGRTPRTPEQAERGRVPPEADDLRRHRPLRLRHRAA